MNGVLDAKSPHEALSLALALGRDLLGLESLTDERMSEARTLLSLAAGVSRAGLVTLDVKEFSEEMMSRYVELIERRKSGTPMSHLRGTRDFYKHTFKVTPDVLDPRADTEVLVETALSEPFDRVLDLGTGSGCVVLSLLAERKASLGVAADISEAALVVAQQNAELLGVRSRVDFTCSDWFEQIEGRFDLIVSNPPYISLQDYEKLKIDVRGFEPRIALTDEGDGLSVYRLLCAQSGAYLRHGGHLMVEIGFDQSRAVTQIFQAAGFREIQCLHDIEGRDRVITGLWDHDIGAISS